VKRSDFFFQNGDRSLRRIGVPVAVDPLADEVFVFPDVAPVVRLVAVAVVAVRTPGTRIDSILECNWVNKMFLRTQRQNSRLDLGWFPCISKVYADWFNFLRYIIL
jgi:hypothetical protein